jgi:hypothetical protein
MLITGTTIILVLIASIYAYQILEQQRGLSEFDVAQKSILSFNDALENVAWKLQGARSTRFTIEYGYLQLTTNTYAIGINATVGGSTWQLSNATFPGSSGKVLYYISDKYTSFGEGYSSYILGNSSSILVGSAENYGRAVIQQQASWVSIQLDYRVRAMRTSVVNVGGKDVNYVDIWVIKLKTLVSQPWSYIHDFDLKAKCTSIKTVTYGPYAVGGNPNAVISVRIGGASTDSGSVPLVTTSQSQVVFNVVVAEVQVYV